MQLMCVNENVKPEVMSMTLQTNGVVNYSRFACFPLSFFFLTLEDDKLNP